MNTTEKFREMVVFDFSNLNIEMSGDDNCYCHCDSGDCDSCDFSCDCDGGCEM